MLTLKVGDNLHISGNNVISYDTVVAKISGNDLIELGKYSRTTTRHIHKVTDLFGLNLIRSNKRKDDFYCHEMGVKVNFSSSLGVRTTEKIAEIVREGASIENSIYLVDLTKLTKNDREELEYLLSKKGISDDKIEALKSWDSIRNMI